VIHLRARFRTRERALQVTRLLKGLATVYPPEITDDAAYPWSMEVEYRDQQVGAEVLRIIGEYGGVMYQEDE
jgi:hypothetical protein